MANRSKSWLYAHGVVRVGSAFDAMQVRCKLCDRQWKVDPDKDKFWLCSNGCNNLLTS